MAKRPVLRRLGWASLAVVLTAAGSLVSVNPAQAAEVAVIADGSTAWQYYVGYGADPSPGADPQAWARPGFNASAWPSGVGGFGFGGGVIGTATAPVATILPQFLNGASGADIPAYFFRHDFTLTTAQLAAAKGAELKLSFDDAVVVYLNGHRVYGYNDWYGLTNTSYMGSGNGNAGQSNPYDETVTFPAEYLQAGVNTVAVELHNCNSASSDIYLNVEKLALTTTFTPTAFPAAALSYAYPSDTQPANTTGHFLTDMLTEYNTLPASIRGVNSPSGCDTLAGVGCQVVSAATALEDLAWNDRVHVSINNQYMTGKLSGDAALSAQVDRAEYDADNSPSVTERDALGTVLSGVYSSAVTAGELPKTVALISDVEANIGGSGSPKVYYGWGRPFIRMGFTPATCGGDAALYPAGTCAAGRIMKSVNSLYSYPSIWMTSFPSGHTYSGYTFGVLLATLLPEFDEQIMARAAEYGNNRIVIGFHYPLDVMGGRMIGTRVIQQRWADPLYRHLLGEASAELHAVLGERCRALGHATLTACYQAGTPYLSSDAAVQYYTEKMTYGFPRINTTDYPVVVPSGAEDLLLSAFPDLTAAQRRAVLVDTAIPSGYALDKSYLGAAGDSYQRLNLAAAMARFQLIVDGGSGTGGYAAGQKVTIKATVPAGKQFASWTITGAKGTLANAKAASTTYTMGSGAATLTPTFVPKVTKIRTPLSTVYLQYRKSYTVKYVTDGATDALSGWKSSNTKVATVSKAGKITAKSKAGTAKITATTQNGKKLTITVKVSKKAVKLTKLAATAPASLKVGKTAQVKLQRTPAKATNLTSVTYKSSNTKILKVDKAGKLTALKKGKATLTIKTADKTYTKRITVK
ncbi:MAG: Ig-like domain-containing protein [Propionibacteriaceae bacterium]|jgi:hypothetical protein|nr:Ig-like domain-containing protein [Propionibacteriaceae bacterium]